MNICARVTQPGGLDGELSWVGVQAQGPSQQPPTAAQVGESSHLRDQVHRPASSWGCVFSLEAAACGSWPSWTVTDRSFALLGYEQPGAGLLTLMTFPQLPHHPSLSQGQDGESAKDLRRAPASNLTAKETPWSINPRPGVAVGKPGWAAAAWPHSGFPTLSVRVPRCLPSPGPGGLPLRRRFPMVPRAAPAAAHPEPPRPALQQPQEGGTWPWVGGSSQVLEG